MKTPKQIPMLFSTPMVQAILDGRKTMTRRIIKNHTAQDWNAEEMEGVHHAFKEWINEDTGKTEPAEWLLLNGDGDVEDVIGPCRYGKPGDVIWVRETFKIGAWNDLDHKMAFDYKASPELTKTPWCEFELIDRFDKYHLKALDELMELDIEPIVNEKEERFYYRWEPGQSPLKWKPNIFMPKEAARIWLKVKSIRIERLQDISDEDCIAEGIIKYPEMAYPQNWHDYMDPLVPPLISPYDSFESLWLSINGNKSWDENPFVWVVEFEVLSTTGKPESLKEKELDT